MLYNDLETEFIELYKLTSQGFPSNPPLMEVTKNHTFTRIPPQPRYRLNGFYIRPDASELVDLVLIDDFKSLFAPYGVKASMRDVGILTSIEVFRLLVESCKKKGDTLREHAYTYLEHTLQIYLASYENAPFLGLAAQCLIWGSLQSDANPKASCQPLSNSKVISFCEHRQNKPT